jgi:hypothetical protein
MELTAPEETLAFVYGRSAPPGSLDDRGISRTKKAGEACNRYRLCLRHSLQYGMRVSDANARDGRKDRQLIRDELGPATPT